MGKYRLVIRLERVFIRFLTSEHIKEYGILYAILWCVLVILIWAWRNC